MAVDVLVADGLHAAVNAYSRLALSAISEVQVGPVKMIRHRRRKDATRVRHADDFHHEFDRSAAGEVTHRQTGPGTSKR